MASNTQKVIATAGIVSVAVGSANAMVKYKRPPSSRFLIGSGVAYFLLSAMGTSEAMGELAKGLALGIMTTILLGDGGGVLSYFAGEEEVNTTRPDKKERATMEKARGQVTRLVPNPNGGFRSDVVPPFPGISATPPHAVTINRVP